MESREHAYKAGQIDCMGYFAYPTIAEHPPVVIIAPTWEGINDFAKKQAEELAEHGYAAFVADLYGEGKSPKAPEEAGKMMTPLFIDRQLLRERILAAYHEVKTFSECDAEKMAAIGFCFGGLTVIELMRSGAQLNGVVSIHGVLGNRLGETISRLAPNAERYNAPFLLLHGYKDPLVPISDVLSLQQELSDRDVDWQTNIHGTAAHAFTNPEAHDISSGMYFDKKTQERSMSALHHFLKEIFNG